MPYYCDVHLCYSNMVMDPTRTCGITSIIVYNTFIFQILCHVHAVSQSKCTDTRQIAGDDHAQGSM